jgi:hypothetical protein
MGLLYGSPRNSRLRHLALIGLHSQLQNQDSFELYRRNYSDRDHEWLCYYCDDSFGKASDFDQSDDTYLEVSGSTRTNIHDE